MKRTLYLKLLIGYAAFGILGFITIATFTSQLALNYIKRDTASNLYREANLLASNYASNYYRGNMTLEDVTAHFQAVSTYLDANIQVVSNNGKIMIHSGQESSANGLKILILQSLAPATIRLVLFSAHSQRKPYRFSRLLPSIIK